MYILEVVFKVSSAGMLTEVSIPQHKKFMHLTVFIVCVYQLKKMQKWIEALSASALLIYIALVYQNIKLPYKNMRPIHHHSKFPFLCIEYL